MVLGGRRRRLFLGIAGGFVVLVAGGVPLLTRDGGEDQAVRPAATPRTTTTTVPPPPPPPPRLFPLLGFPDATPDHPALAVKIDNVEKARPPVGLLAADVVIEEVVEGGLTRLMALFHSTDPGAVGPVRSARSTDLLFLAELGRPLFAWSGANVDFAADVQAANLVDVGPGAAGGAYWRGPGRPAPSNLFATPTTLREIGAAGGGTPPPLMFTYRQPGEPIVGPGMGPGNSLHAGGQSSDLRTVIDWGWDPATGRYFRSQNGTPHLDADGSSVTAVNVVVRITPYRDSLYRDTTGAVVPEAVAVGQGEAWLLTQGLAQPAVWTKAAPDQPTVYTAVDGTPLRLVPGQTWVEIVPPGTAVIG